MATQPIVISVTVNGANNAARQITNVGTAAGRAERSVFNLRNLLLGFSVVSLAKGLLAITDVATRLDNRLNVLTGSQARSNELFRELLKVSNDTRSDLEETVNNYARLERSTQGYNLTGRELLDLTKGINQSFKIFGNTSAESAAALVQFTQGLSVGVLRGDELRSVLEQAPRLAKAIADGLNEIPEGQELAGKFGRLFKDFESGAISSELLSGSLRQLGATGKLTGELITKALLTQLGKLNEEFERTTPTIEDSITIVKNNFIALARDPSFRLFAKSVATALINFAEEIPKVVDAIRPFIVILAEGVGLFSDLISIGAEFVGAISELFVSLAETALGAFGVVATAGEDSGVTFSKVFVNAFGIIFNSFKTVIDTLVRGAAFIGGFIAGVAKDIFLAFDVAFDAISGAAEGLINFLIDGLNVFKGESEKIAKVNFTSDNDQFKNEFLNPLEAGTDAANKMSAAVDKVFAPFEVAGEKAGNAIVAFSQRSADALAKIRSEVQEVADTVNEITGDAEALPVETQLNANDQRRLDSFLDRLADLREGADSGVEGLRELKRAQEQYDKLAGNDEIAKKLQGRSKQEEEFAALRTKYSLQAVADLMQESMAQEDAAQSSLDHYRAYRLLTKALKDGDDVTQAQIDTLAAQLKVERDVIDAQREKDNILDSLTRKADQYNAVLKATNELLGKGTITEQQQAQFLKETDVGRGVEDAKQFVADESLNPEDKIARELELLQAEEDARIAFIDEAALLNQERLVEYEQLRLDTIEAYSKKETEIRLAAQSLQYQNASSAFGDLAELSKGFVKESSGVYKTLFAVSKAFAIADGFVKLNQAIMNASVSLPFPANLAAMAQVGAAGLGLLASIKGAVAPDVALKDGGFVVGPGGPRDDAVNAALSNGEFVVRADAAARNADLLEAINSGRFNSGQGGGLTLNLTQNVNGVTDAQGFRASGRQVAQDTARVVERAIARNS
jgi:tape measure domain-containing protein